MFIICVNNYAMDSTKISLYIDKAGRGIVVYVLLFVWLRYYIHNTYILVAVTFAIAFVLVTVIDSWLYGRQLKRLKAYNLNRDIDAYMYSLLFMDREECTLFFMNGMNEVGTHIDNDMIIKGTVGIAPVFDKYTLSQEDIVHVLMQAKKMGLSHIVILCNDCVNKTPRLNGIKLDIMTKFEVFNNVFSKYNFYPVVEVAINTKTDFRRIIKLFFEPHKAWRYFLSGVVLFICSYFVYMRIYYLIFGSMLMVLALICLYNRKYVTKHKENIW